jgi:hypothetical protein
MSIHENTHDDRSKELGRKNRECGGIFENFIIEFCSCLRMAYTIPEGNISCKKNTVTA